MDSMMVIALMDAATNCQRDGATSTLTLRSGVQLVGKLYKPDSAQPTTGHVETASGGWVTFLTEELVAVEVAR